MAKERLVGEIAVRPVLEEGEVARAGREAAGAGDSGHVRRRADRAQKLTPVAGADAGASSRCAGDRSCGACRPRPPLRRRRPQPTVTPPATAPAGASGCTAPAAAPATAAPPASASERRRQLQRPWHGARGRSGAAAARAGRSPRRAASRRPFHTCAVSTSRAASLGRDGPEPRRDCCRSRWSPLAPPPEPCGRGRPRRAVIVEWDAEPRDSATTSTAATSCCSRSIRRR